MEEDVELCMTSDCDDALADCEVETGADTEGEVED